MNSYLLDIQNKIGLISDQSVLLSKKYTPDDFLVINESIYQINDIVEKASNSLLFELSVKLLRVSLREFTDNVTLILESLKLTNNLNITTDILDFNSDQDYKIDMNNDVILQIFECAFADSIHRNADKVKVRILETSSSLILEFVDNGNYSLLENTITSARSLPPNIITKMMNSNMIRHHGRVDWKNRIDANGVIVRFYFPKH
jgi:hypothetical protein